MSRETATNSWRNVAELYRQEALMNYMQLLGDITEENCHALFAFSQVILADEISPDSCRLWDSTTNEKLDKDRFRRDLGSVIESYTEVARRLGVMKEMPTVIQGGIH